MKHTIRSNNRLTLGVGALAAGCFATAHAAWDVVPQVGLTTEVDDNARLIPLDQPTSSRTALDARLRLRAIGDRGEAYIEPRFVTDSYADDVDQPLESNDTFLLTRATHDFGSTLFEFRTDYRHESVLRSEIDSALPDDVDLGGGAVDTGGGTVVGTFADDRKRFDIGMSGEFTLSPRTNLRLEGDRIDVGYPDSTNPNRSPFDDNTLGVVLTRLVDQRNQVSARVYFSDFHADINDNDTEAFGVQGTFARPVSETWTFQFDAGVARTDYRFTADDGSIVDNADSSFTFGAEFEKETQLTTWSLGLGRSIDPNSNGFLSARDDLQVRVLHRFTQRLRATAGLRGSRVDTPVEDEGNSDRDYWRASFEIEWAMTPRWMLTTGFDRVTEEFVDAGADATSNAVIVGVRYRGLSQQTGP
jgi:hypothetical protein